MNTNAQQRQKEIEQGYGYHVVLGAFGLTIFSLMFWAFTGSLAWGAGIAWLIVLFISGLPDHKDIRNKRMEQACTEVRKWLNEAGDELPENKAGEFYSQAQTLGWALDYNPEDNE